MKFLTSSKVIMICSILIVVFAIFWAYEFNLLKKAHSTLQNYATFRGCISLSMNTDTSAVCTLQSGKKITLVQVKNRWYLEGDIPGVW